MKEQIEKMARIICRDYNGGVCGLDETSCNYNCEWTQIAKHLYNAGYRKQSANIVELPCKVGDMVYIPWEWHGVKSIACLKVTTINCIIGFGWSFGTDFDTDDDGYAEKYNYGRFRFDDIGKIVFLTSEDAEAKMKGGAE